MKHSLHHFLEAQKGNKIVVVQGLGFVGAVMSLIVANCEENYAVIGIDLPENQSLINRLNNQEFPIKCSDSKVYEYFEKTTIRGNFYATSDTDAYTFADVIIVDINLDVEKGKKDKRLGNNYSVSLEGFKTAMKTIALKCKPQVLILIETTVPPGTCQKIVKPIFEKAFLSRHLPFDFMIGHSYERVMPGPGYVDSIKNFFRVFAGIDERSTDAVESFLKTIISTETYPLTKLGNTTASEMAKVLENSFRAMNIAFIQEWTEFAEAAGVNLYEVIDAIRLRPTHKSIMRPGLGVGGYCLTKDPLLASWASQSFFYSNKLKQSEKAVSINDKMPLHSLKLLKRSLGRVKGKKILILGVSYLQNVGDTRFSPVQPVFQHMKKAGASITVHDPYVEFWEEVEVRPAKTEVVFNQRFDAVFLGCPHDIYINNGFFEKILRSKEAIFVFDPHGAIPANLKKKFSHHSYIITGRGDE